MISWAFVALRFCAVVLIIWCNVNHQTVVGLDYNAFGLDCWEACFADGFTKDEDEVKEQYEKFYFLVQMVKEVKMMKGINSTVLLIDTSVSSKHSREANFGGIFTFQQHLATLFGYTMPATDNKNPFYGVQFDGEQAWSCNNWSCNDRCGAAEVILNDFEDVLESDRRGQLEDACHLSLRALKRDCLSATRKPLLLAIVNSPFDDHHQQQSRHHHHRSESSCSLFPDRVIVGTHAANQKQMKKWASRHNNFDYVEDSPLAKQVLKELVDCLDTECCAASSFTPSLTPSCVRTLSGYSVNAFGWQS